MEVTQIHQFWNLKIIETRLNKNKDGLSLILSNQKRKRMINAMLIDFKTIFKTTNPKNIGKIYNKWIPEKRKENIDKIPHSLVEFEIVDEIEIKQIDEVKK